MTVLTLAAALLVHTGAASSTARAAGLPAVVWTVDRPARVRELLRAGVQALITNHPARGAAILREVVSPPGP